MPPRTEAPSASGASLSPARLAALLTAAVAALEHQQAQQASSSGGGGSDGEADVAHEAALAAFERACQVRDGVTAAAAGAGLVPLPSPSADVDAALASLTQVISSGCSGPARGAAARALFVLGAVLFASPRRAAALAQRGALMRSLAGALGVRGDEHLLGSACFAASHILVFAGTQPAVVAAWRDRESAASLRALTASFAGALGALEAAEALDPAFEPQAFISLAAVLKACPDKPGVSESMLAQPGFADVLCACIARAAAARPVAVTAELMRGMAPLAAAVALGSGGKLSLVPDEMGRGLACSPILEQPAPEPLLAEHLLAAAPALLGHVVDVVAAGAPWYEAAAAALGAGAGSSAGDAGLVAGFSHCANLLWAWAVSVLELVPERALLAAGDGALIARLAPPLLGLAEAAQAVAGALPVSLVADSVRVDMVRLASAAVGVLARAVHALGGAAPALADAVPGALPALLRLCVSELPVLAAGGGQALALLQQHCSTRLHAAQTLGSFLNQGAAPQVAAMLAASPALAAALSATVGATDSDRRLLREDASASALVSMRCITTACLLTFVARQCAASAGRRASWLCGLSK